MGWSLFSSLIGWPRKPRGENHVSLESVWKIRWLLLILPMGQLVVVSMCASNSIWIFNEHLKHFLLRALGKYANLTSFEMICKLTSRQASRRAGRHKSYGKKCAEYFARRVCRENSCPAVTTNQKTAIQSHHINNN